MCREERSTRLIEFLVVFAHRICRPPLRKLSLTRADVQGVRLLRWLQIPAVVFRYIISVPYYQFISSRTAKRKY